MPLKGNRDDLKPNCDGIFIDQKFSCLTYWHGVQLRYQSCCTNSCSLNNKSFIKHGFSITSIET